MQEVAEDLILGLGALSLVKDRIPTLPLWSSRKDQVIPDLLSARAYSLLYSTIHMHILYHGPHHGPPSLSRQLYRITRVPAEMQ